MLSLAGDSTSNPLSSTVSTIPVSYTHLVRSSSIMEDGYGNAFSGKYESVFCMNQGTKEDRLEELECAVRRVYASVMNEQAIEYRLSLIHI